MRINCPQQSGGCCSTSCLANDCLMRGGILKAQHLHVVQGSRLYKSCALEKFPGSVVTDDKPSGWFIFVSVFK